MSVPTIPSTMSNRHSFSPSHPSKPRKRQHLATFKPIQTHFWSRGLTALYLLLLCGVALAQVCATPARDSATTSIAGIINSYYPGSAGSVAAGAVAVPVGVISPTGSSTPVAAGDLLIVMQMQGAQIDSSNSDCYGDSVGTAGCATRTTTTASYAGGNLNNLSYLAGNWEYCTATTAAGATIGVACAGTAGGTVNAYQSTASVGTSTNGSYTYQVIRVPQYASVALTANVVPQAWNGSTGGVLGLQANGTITMAGFNLDASSRGFRGGGQTFTAPYGPPVLDPVNGTTFYRAAAGNLAAAPGGELEGSFKGEGIAGTPRLVYNGTAQVDALIDGYPAGSRGRGAPGNAGGGGNNQNGGGGGGSNGGQGGQGGGGWNDASRPTTFRDSGGFGGDGASRAGNNLALSPTRLLMGGGGGAGHVDGGGTNCQLGGWGGNGGGIIVVRAASMTGTGSLLNNGSNGFLPNFTAGGCTDAAGGAGAGGTIYAAIANGLAGRTLQSNGGNGVNSSYSEHGPGGGGGGGVNYFNGTGTPANTANGGINGLDRGNTVPQTNWFATAGANSTLNSVNSAVTTTCSTILAVTKTNAVTAVTAGGTTSYTVTFTNTGATAADGSNASDMPTAGLSCIVGACTASATPIAASCPIPAQWPSLLTVGGVLLPAFPARSTVTFVVNCNVTATGQ